MFNTTVLTQFIGSLMNCDPEDLTESDIKNFENDMYDIKYFLIKDGFVRELDRRGYNTSNLRAIRAIIERYIL